MSEIHDVLTQMFISKGLESTSYAVQLIQPDSGQIGSVTLRACGHVAFRASEILFELYLNVLYDLFK